jgi:hypothetical protein
MKVICTVEEFFELVHLHDPSRYYMMKGEDVVLNEEAALKEACEIMQSFNRAKIYEDETTPRIIHHGWGVHFTEREIYPEWTGWIHLPDNGRCKSICVEISACDDELTITSNDVARMDVEEFIALVARFYALVDETRLQ